MNVFIIGGTTGIGFALAHFYQQSGHRVGVCGRDLSKLPKTVPFESYKADVIDKALLTQVIRQFVGSDTLSLLINCAGSYAEDVVGEISYEEAVSMLQTNIIGAVNTLEVGRELMASIYLRNFGLSLLQPIYQDQAQCFTDSRCL